MEALAVVPAATAPTVDGCPPTVTVRSEGSTLRRLSPDGVSLWMYELTMPHGGELQVDRQHGDEAIYVLEGEIAVGEPALQRAVPVGGALIVESAVAARVTVDRPARLLLMGPQDTGVPVDGPLGPAQPDRHAVHAVGPRGLYAQVDAARDSTFFADSSCPTCRITLLRTGRSERYVSAAHSHSQDELIHLLSGEITVGRERLQPGDTLYVAAHRRYTFTSGDRGFSFLNYRRDASMHTLVRGGAPVLEGGAAHGFEYVGDVR